MLRRAIPSVVTLLLGVAVVAWTVWLPTSLDALWPWQSVAEGSTGGLLAVIWANVLQPVVAYIIMFFLVGVLFRRRWRDLAGSMLLAIGLTVSITTVLKSLVGRTRPDTPWIGHLDALASYPPGMPPRERPWRSGSSRPPGRSPGTSAPPCSSRWPRPCWPRPLPSGGSCSPSTTSAMSSAARSSPSSPPRWLRR